MASRAKTQFNTPRSARYRGPSRRPLPGATFTALVFAHANVRETQGPQRRLPRRAAAGRHADHDRQALCAVGDLHVRAFGRGRDGADHQPARAAHQLPRAAEAAQHHAGKRRRRCEVEPADMDVHVGGPVETGRGFVLHSSDYYAADSTLPIDEGVSLTATIDILKAIAGGKGPTGPSWRSAMPAGGPASSRARSHANGWLHCPADARSAVRPRPRAEVRAGDVEDRHRSLPSRQRGRPRLTARRGRRAVAVSRLARWPSCARLAAGGERPCRRSPVGSPARSRSAGELGQALGDRRRQLGEVGRRPAVGRRGPGAAAARCRCARQRRRPAPCRRCRSQRQRRRPGAGCARPARRPVARSCAVGRRLRWRAAARGCMARRRTAAASAAASASGHASAGAAGGRGQRRRPAGAAAAPLPRVVGGAAGCGGAVRRPRRAASAAVGRRARPSACGSGLRCGARPRRRGGAGCGAARLLRRPARACATGCSASCAARPGAPPSGAAAPRARTSARRSRSPARTRSRSCAAGRRRPRSRRPRPPPSCRARGRAPRSSAGSPSRCRSRRWPAGTSGRS